ncbi:MAG: hypothetical protein NTY88_02745 [Bacteroidetes bacterium]|nr:hypothetical protein [Bacteroidota bacterium]
MKKQTTLLFIFSLVLSATVFAQAKKPIYHPCFLMDSVEVKLPFIQQNAYRIFVDTFDCRQMLLDKIGILYLKTGDKKYLTALETIHQRAGEKVENLYTDIIKRFCEKDFTAFARELFVARGQYYNLERELIATMNMLVDGRSLKLKYMGALNVQIDKARDKKDYNAISFWEKLKKRIEDEKY